MLGARVEIDGADRKRTDGQWQRIDAADGESRDCLGERRPSHARLFHETRDDYRSLNAVSLPPGAFACVELELHDPGRHLIAGTDGLHVERRAECRYRGPVDLQRLDESDAEVVRREMSCCRDGGLLVP